MTDRSFAGEPGHCPCCGSDQIEGSSWDVYNEYAQQEVSCVNCGAAWDDIYRLVDIEITRRPDHELELD